MLNRLMPKVRSEKWATALRIAATVIGLDALTKLLAWLILSRVEHCPAAGDLCLRLYFNAQSMGARTQQSLPHIGASPNYPLLGGIWLIASAYCTVRFVREDMPAMRKALWIGTLLAAAALAGLISATLLGPEPLIGGRVAFVTRGVGVLGFQWAVMRVTRNRLFFQVLTMLASANLANVLNSALVPQGIIDFLWFRPLANRMANVADLTMNVAGYALGGVLILLLLARRGVRRANGREGAVQRMSRWMLRAYET